MTRHELKAQDEITTKLQTFTETAYDRRKEILTGVAVVVVLILAFVGWRFYAAHRDANAQSMLGLVTAVFDDPSIASDKERYERTIAEAQKTVDAYGSHPAGVIAKYYIALSQAGLGDTQTAVQNLEQVIADANGDIRPVAQFALAEMHSKQGDPAKAVEVLKQLEESGGYAKSAVTYELAVASESANHADQAQTYYSKVITDFPDSPFRQNAEAALKRMGVALPAPAPPSIPAPAVP